MSKGDIALKSEIVNVRNGEQTVSGTVSAVNTEKKEITVDARTPEGTKSIVVAPADNTIFRRYAPDSIRFGDAKSSSFADLKVGDQLRARGTKSSDGLRFTPAELVSGSFQTIGGNMLQGGQQGRGSAVALGAMSLGRDRQIRSRSRGREGVGAGNATR